GGEPQLRAILDDFGKRFSKYVLNLSGHAHAYERTKPQAHVVHVTVGIGGSALEHTPTAWRRTGWNAPAPTPLRGLHHRFVKLIAQADGIALEAICAGVSLKEDNIRCGDGEIMDQTLIPAGGAPAVASARRPNERQQRGSAGGGDRSA